MDPHPIVSDGKRGFQRPKSHLKWITSNSGEVNAIEKLNIERQPDIDPVPTEISNLRYSVMLAVLRALSGNYKDASRECGGYE